MKIRLTRAAALLAVSLLTIAHPGVLRAQDDVPAVPDDPMMDARAAEARADPAEALARYLRVLAQRPRDLSALTGAGRAALDIGDGNAAIGFYARAEQVAPNDGKVKAGLASALVQIGQPRAALKLFDQATALGVPEAGIAADRGLAYDLRGDSRRAQRDYALALSKGPNDETTRRLALSMAISGDRSGALAVLDPLLRRQDKAAWRARAFVYALTGDTQTAGDTARLLMPSNQAAAITPFLAKIGTLKPAQKAMAVNFGQIPTDADADAKSRTQLASNQDVLSSASPFGVALPPTAASSRPDRGLIPAGKPLGRPEAADSDDGDTAHVEPAQPVQPVQPIQPVRGGHASRQADRASEEFVIAPDVSRIGAAPIPSSAPVDQKLAAAATRAVQPAPARAVPQSVETRLASAADRAVAPAAAPGGPHYLMPPVTQTPVASTPVPAASAAVATPAPVPTPAAVAAQPPAAVPAEAAKPASPTPPPPAQAAATPARSIYGPIDIPDPRVPQPAQPAQSPPPAVQATAAPVRPVVAPPAETATSHMAAAPRPAAVPVKPKPTNLASITPLDIEPAAKARRKDTEQPVAADKGKAVEKDLPGGKGKLAKDDCVEPAGNRAGRGAHRRGAANSAKCAADDSKTREAEAKAKTRDGANATADEECESTTKARGRGRGAKPSARCAAGDGKAREAEAKAKDKASASAAEECATAAKGRGRGKAAKPSAKCAALAAKDSKDEKDAKGKAGSKTASGKGDEATAKDGKAAGERYWVQVASGSNKANLGKAWDQVKTKSRLLEGRTPSSAPWRGSNRILVGPFKTDEEAQDFVNKLGKQGVSGIQFTSRKGVAVEKLPSN